MEKQDLQPRNYQVSLMEIALAKNSIIFLPTGSGKTFIALMVLKKMSESLSVSYNCGGKISVILVNTVALVDQHGKYVRNHTVLSVGCYSGEMNLDFWKESKWLTEFDQHQVLVMTSEIFRNLVEKNFIDLNKVNLLIFDECHHAVHDHAMRQIMRIFGSVKEPPRVIGLTATLLNSNCTPNTVINEVKSLEVTFHAQVATVDGLDSVVGYSTNPVEEIINYKTHICTSIEMEAIAFLEDAATVLKRIKLDSDKPRRTIDLPPLEPKESLKCLELMLRDLILCIQTFGIYGGFRACLMDLIKVECIRIHCDELDLFDILTYLTTIISHVKDEFNAVLKQLPVEQQHKFSSNKVLTLLQLLRHYKYNSKEEMCAIVFTKRRSTAQVLYYILNDVCEHDEEIKYIKPNFIIGHNNNPYIQTREGLYISKKNKQALEEFVNKETNVMCSSNVLEEGIDIPTCSLVIRFDEPEEYRAYIQSKGRARHKKSLYYIMLNEDINEKYMKKYESFKENESILNEYLIGQNDDRSEPSQEDIEKMYNEDAIPPYFTNGPGSARISMFNAIPLLCQYCSSLPGDIYTKYQPEWYLDAKDDQIRVVIILPIICPIKHYIYGPYMENKLLAKRAAAMSACIALHKCGELDDSLRAKKSVVDTVDTSFLFTHYPDVKEENVGTGKRRRLHRKIVPNCLRGLIQPHRNVFLHVIFLQPTFARTENIHNSTFYDIYASNLCFGVLTAEPLLKICDFPIYVTQGRIHVSIKMNEKVVVLNEENIANIKKFHYCVFNDVLDVFKDFFLFDQSGESEMMYLVPINRDTITIDWRIVMEHQQIKPIVEPKLEDKKNMVVTQENYLKKIVKPWYREPVAYLVTEVRLNKSPLDPFPNNDFGTFIDYFNEKYQIRIVNENQPLVLVKGISKKLNFIKPRGIMQKRKRERAYDENEEDLVPEMLIKQDYPSELWIQAHFLPTILTRISSLLQAEEFRRRVAMESGLGAQTFITTSSLVLDDYLINYEIEEEKTDEVDQVPKLEIEVDNAEMLPMARLKAYNKDFGAKILENEYPWRDIDEPKDIYRTLNVSATDIYYYEKFISISIKPELFEMKNLSPFKRNLPAIAYTKDFVHKPIKLMQQLGNKSGPELCEIYKALTTAAAKDIVNLERLETLGDSFLKYIVSVYLSLRFPKYKEGELTSLKGRMVSNKSLYYLAVKKKLNGIIRYHDLTPKDEWLPPCYTIPKTIKERILNKEISVNSLFNNFNLSIEEQINGNLETNRSFETFEVGDDEANSYNNTACFLHCEYVGDKFISDCVESLLGAYFEACGIEGACKFVEWMGVIPASENLLAIMRQTPDNPVLNPNSTLKNIDFHLGEWQEFERRLGYHFQNRGYLLQALTHASYTSNRITLSYEKLEFVGDAILDFLITCHIYESCGKLSPGELTDLRSALVNNNTFASLLVRNGFHKFILTLNMQLQRQIDKFADFSAERNYVIDDEVLILLDENDIKMAEYIDVPKALGDVFEAIAGAVYLDSNKNLDTVWRVFYKLMWNEIELFSRNVPKNVVRQIFESNTYPCFSGPRQVNAHVTMVALEFLSDGRRKRVHGFGSNKQMAKKAAAKIALRSLKT